MTDSKYQKAKIYKILNSLDDEIYIGSTVEKLTQRMAKHRSKCETKQNYRIYQHMLKHGKDNFYIELIEHYPCNSKEELTAREGEWIRTIGTLNQKVAGRNAKTWYQDNVEEQKGKMAEYRENNREIIRQKEKEFRDNNLERVREQDRQRYREDPEKRKAYVKEWKDRNPEYNTEYSKRWRENNKERKKEMDKAYSQIEILCETCQCKVKKCRMTKHNKTKKHIELMNQ